MVTLDICGERTASEGGPYNCAEEILRQAGGYYFG